jgi:pimeloyl-ACP methyl ester carboxylesterase
VYPGLTANDASTIPLRRFLTQLGYTTSGWEQGFNLGPRQGVMEQAQAHIEQAHAASGRTISLIGWSLGGLYARELAKILPSKIRTVITLGTPFSAPPASTNAGWIYRLASGRDPDTEHANLSLADAPGVPTTSVYSRSDGVVAWQGSVQAPSDHNPQTENIEVSASHIGMGMNPSAWWVLADRLAQAEGAWKPFNRDALLKRMLYPNPARPE